MTSNLLNSVKDFITPDLINKASSYLGENSQDVSKAIGISIPAVLAALISRAESGDAAAVLNTAKDAASNNVLGTLNSLFSGGSSSLAGFSSISNLFGNNSGSITNALSNFSGIKSSSANSLLNMIIPLVLGVIGKHAISNNLSSGGLLSLLSGHKSSVTGELPSGLNPGNWFSSAKTTLAATAGEVRSAAETPKRNRLWPILLGLIALILIIYFIRSCNKHAETAVTAPDTAIASPVPDTTMIAPARESMMVKLPDGSELNAYKGGIEDMLVSCLNSDTCKPGKDKWFDFDNLNFEMSSAAITAESQVQINNIVAILKAYPKAKIKIGGYTDKTGDDAGNKKLSQSRADAVFIALKTAGANSSQLAGAEGYGSEFAKIPESASDDERKTDRRISVQLREK